MRHNLSEIKALIEDRRSIAPELYSARTVHEEVLMELLDMARWAPTHRYTQPWYFKIFLGDGRATLGQIMAQIYRDTTPAEARSEVKEAKLRERPLLAPAVIAIGLRRDPEKRDPLQEEIASVAMAVQNMKLVAAAHGLGMYWTTGGVTYTDGMRAAMGLGPDDLFLGLLYVGYPDGDWPRPTRRRPVEYYTDWVRG